MQFSTSQRLSRYQRFSSAEGKHFALRQIAYICSLGFTCCQAWAILDAATPTRCAEAARWAVRMLDAGFTWDMIDHYLASNRALRKSLIGVSGNQRMEVINRRLVIKLNYEANPGGSILGFEMFFAGVKRAMIYLAMNRSS